MTTLEPGHAAGFLLAGALALAAALAGRPELLVAAIPLGLYLLRSLSAGEPPALEAGIDVRDPRVAEGDRVEVEIRLTSVRDVADLEVGIASSPNLEPRGPATFRVSLEADTPRRITFGFRARRWGAARVGPVAVRVRDGVLRHEATLCEPVVVRIYPDIQRLRRSLRPLTTQVFAGSYTAPRAGTGIEFASVRPYTRGDRIRHVNWRVSTRRRDLHVNTYHPERNADVVLWLDTFSVAGPPGASSLDNEVRAAATLAHHYLAHRDRVGLVSFGGALSWLSAAMGRSQLRRIIDHLIDVDVAFSYAWKGVDVLPRRTLPPRAQVIALTPLTDDRSIAALADIAGRGFDLTVLDVLPEARISAGRGRSDKVAHRLWRLYREAVRSELAARGAVVARWDGSEPLQVPLASVAGVRRRRTEV